MRLSEKYRRWFFAALLALGLSCLAACESSPTAEMYDFVYASGYSRDAYTRDELLPVEGTDFNLTLKQGDGLTLQLLGAEGAVLGSYAEDLPALQRRELLTVRGEAAARGVIISSGGICLPFNEETGEGAVWLCSEVWSKTRYNGFVDGALRGGRLLLVDAQTGRTLCRRDTQPGELFLTASGNRCYFYTPGKVARRKEDQTPAQIYWRDINSWLFAHTVCSFDYVGTPVFEGQTIERLRFYPQADILRLDFTCYEQTNVENDRWDYVVKHSVEVPLTQNLPETPESEAEPAE